MQSVPEHQIEESAPESYPGTLKGKLAHRGSFAWRIRYCMFDGNTLQLFEDANYSRPKECLTIDDTVNIEKCEDSKMPFAFEIKLQNQSFAHIFNPQDKATCDLWLNRLQGGRRNSTVSESESDASSYWNTWGSNPPKININTLFKKRSEKPVPAPKKMPILMKKP
jgi:hypothetical protein